MKIELISATPPSRIVVDELPAIIGRDAAADVCLEDSWVGRYQCMLSDDETAVVVLDFGSRTGTFVNGRRVRKATLAPGDTLTLGKSEFVVQYQ